MPSSAAIMPAETSGRLHDIVHEGRQARGGTATIELARQQAARREPAIMILEARPRPSRRWPRAWRRAALSPRGPAGARAARDAGRHALLKPSASAHHAIFAG